MNTIIPGKISLYGDSTTAGRGFGPRMLARQPNRIKAVNDYARGGNSFADNLAGRNQLFNGLTFQQHVNEVDDAEVVVIRLGGNCVPGGWKTGDIQGCLEADYLDIAAECLQHVQFARGAQKKPVLVGTPYTNIESAVNYYGMTTERAVTEFQRVRNANTAIRCVSGVYRVPFIATFGYGGNGGYPEPTAADVPDGVHPTEEYGHKVADYLADQLVSIFNW